MYPGYHAASVDPFHFAEAGRDDHVRRVPCWGLGGLTSQAEEQDRAGYVCLRPPEVMGSLWGYE